jgi:hypothetical protein
MKSLVKSYDGKKPPHPSKQTNKETDKQTNKQTNKQTKTVAYG